MSAEAVRVAVRVRMRCVKLHVLFPLDCFYHSVEEDTLIS